MLQTVPGETPAMLRAVYFLLFLDTQKEGSWGWAHLSCLWWGTAEASSPPPRIQLPDPFNNSILKDEVESGPQGRRQWLSP